MAKITAALVTVTLNPEDIDRSPDGRIGKRTFPTVQFGNSALEYTALGIPMPAIGVFGFDFAIKRVYIEQPANGFIYHFDRANQKLRIFEGSAIGAITIANATQTGNVAAPAAHANIQVPAPADHSHTLIVLANGAGQGVADFLAGVNAANSALVSNTATGGNVAGGNATKGGVANGSVPAPANIANQTHNAPAFTGDPHTHALTGAGGSAAAALSEVGSTHAPAATTLYMEMVGR